MRRVDLGAGMTPLRDARNLAGALGMRKLWVKDDSANPTHSFKDRVVSVALSAARAFGYTTVSCASTAAVTADDSVVPRVRISEFRPFAAAVSEAGTACMIRVGIAA